jgi:hypothetical protein
MKLDGVVKSPIYCVVVFFQTLGILHMYSLVPKKYYALYINLFT